MHKPDHVHQPALVLEQTTVTRPEKVMTAVKQSLTCLDVEHVKRSV